MSDVPYRIYLEKDQMPTSWYNIKADMENLPPPPLSPATKQPAGPGDLSAIFPMELILQEVSRERYIPIPEEVQQYYALYRPAPLCRAYNLEKALGTPAHIYYKYEGNAPAGSHKLNTAIPQAYYNKRAGIRRIATETGAGQWGSALSIACGFFDMECTVYMVKISAQQKPYRKTLMETFGATVIPSPSDKTNAGRAVLESDPDSPGSLGMAISEAVEDAATHEDTNYSLGSVLDHVLLHQSIIGQEAVRQMEIAGEYPDMVIACCGGGSNFGGIAFPFFHENLSREKKARLIAVEPTACPTLTRGKYAYDYGDVAGLTPIMAMYTLGHDFVPNGIHAGGLRYHGDSVLVSQLYKDGLIEAVAVNQKQVFEAAIEFAKAEAIIPAPESAHAICKAIEEAKKCKETGEQKTILFCLSGHGNFDLNAYDRYNHGLIDDAEISEADLEKGLETLPSV